MKLYALAASFAVGLAMLPQASAQVRGTIGVGVGDEPDSRGDVGLTIPASSNLAFLVDGTYARDEDTDVFAATGHLISRSSGQAFGGFIGASRTDFGFGDVDSWTAGGEYARFLDRATLAGRLRYSATDDLDADAWGLSGEYRYFANDNLRFDLGAGLSLADDNDDIVLAGGVEYRFGSSPISLGAGVGWINNDNDDETSFNLALRFDFGNSSLKDRDRNGNTFGAVSSMISNILP